MSASIDNVACPECGGNALSEQDTETCEIHVHCTEPNCDYDSDVDDDTYNSICDDVYGEDEDEDEDDF